MAEPEIVDFKPHWMRKRSAEDRVLEGTPLTGSLPKVPPRINARLLPSDGSHKLSAKTLSETISLTQSIVQYAGYDVYHGINPAFADLRSLDSQLVALTRLTIEPFEEGSFVIPARLESEPLERLERPERREISAEDVAERFSQILVSLREPTGASSVSIGAIQAVESLGRVIRREAEAIEFSSFDARGRTLKIWQVDENYVERVRAVRKSRQPTEATLETLEGDVTALDIREGKLQLSVEGHPQRVQGNFSIMFLPSLLESLGRRVKLQGYVTWKRKTPVSIQVIDAEVLSDER